MTLELFEPSGAPPLSPDELLGLKARHITNRGELNELESANIIEGLTWLDGRPKSFDVLTDGMAREIHKRLFGKIWDWAGVNRLSGADGPRVSYSHASALGCQIAIKRHFVSAGLLEVPEDNSHLDDENQLIAAGTLANWNAQTGRPRVGDFLRYPDGSMKRFCNDNYRWGGLVWADILTICILIIHMLSAVLDT